MPFNLLKIYNALLELDGLNPGDRKKSLMGVFNRDFVNKRSFSFQGKHINPTPQDGEISMSTLFSHLTTQIIDKKTRERAFEMHRSKRLHWIKYHIEERKRDNMLIFSAKEPEGFRTYILDKDENYVIVLEPLREKNEYYLLTAFHIKGKDAMRDKFGKKYARRLQQTL